MSISREKAQEVLRCKMVRNDAGASTIRGYLVTLAFTVFDEGEGFSGKRPFGNSGWEHELYESLVKGKLLQGTVDDGEYEFDEPTARTLIFAAIKELMREPESAP